MGEQKNLPYVTTLVLEQSISRPDHHGAEAMSQTHTFLKIAEEDWVL